MRLALIASTILLAVSVGQSRAVVIEPPPVDWGWINSNGEDQTILQPQFPLFSNYIVGLGCCGESGSRIEFRNFFAFMIPESIRSINSATLHLFNPRHGYNSGDSNETVAFFDVVLPIGELMDGGTGLMPYFNDLGEGVSYGSVVVNSADLDRYIDVALNPAALTSIQSARGGLWALGGKLTTISPGYYQTVFGNTPEFERPYLTFDAELIPEPDPDTLLLIVIAAMGVVGGRSKGFYR
jgi:hypothetical protein